MQAFGDDAAVRTAYQAATRRFDGLLAELCQELELLRSPAGSKYALPNGPVARRMVAAVSPFADEHLHHADGRRRRRRRGRDHRRHDAAAPLTRAYVNNGGDIALHLTDKQRFKIGLVDRPDCPSLFGTTEIREEDDIRGIATSGYLGRSFSLGIAEAVTVLARTAAMADAAATVIANAVDLPAIPPFNVCPLTPYSRIATSARSR